MVYYEIKKIFVGMASKVMLLVLIGLIMTVGVMSVSATKWVNAQGVEEKGFNAVSKIKEAKRAWEGAITTEVVAQIIRENARINAEITDPEDKTQQNIAYHKKQGFHDIRNLIANSFTEFREFDYYRTDVLSPDVAGQFYENRVTALKTWLDDEAKTVYTEEEKAHLIHTYESMETPLIYKYQDGWNNLLTYVPTIQLITAVIICMMIAPVFSCEKQLKADSIFYTTQHGRDKAVRAKLAAGLAIITVTYFAVIILYTVVILGIFGAGGARCMIQTNYLFGWKSYHNVTNIQAYILIAGGGYIGSIFLAAFTMLISAQTGSTIFASITVFVIIMIPATLSGSINSLGLLKILNTFPDQLLRLGTVLVQFSFYQIGNRIISTIWIILIIYPLLTIILQPLIYRIYRKKELE